MVNYINPKTMKSKYAGVSADEKPLNVQNGSIYFEINTGKCFMFDEENKLWYEQKDNGDSSALAEQVKTNTEDIKKINERLDGIGIAEGMKV